MRVLTNTISFEKTINNIVEYSFGFIEGANSGKTEFLNNIGKETIQILKKYIDTNAKMNPKLLHHVYEWYKTGSPSARLFDINHTVSNLGLSFKPRFTQSNSLANGAKEPFRNKASVMETGKTIIVKPKKSNVLAFDVDGETVFTSKEVIINNPGGNVQGQFEKVFDSFFNNYFTQSFLNASGIFDHIKNPIIYKKNFAKGAKMGKSIGVQTGYGWVANVKVGELQ